MQDDPAFVPDLALANIDLNLDLPELDFTTSGHSSGQSSFLSSLEGRLSKTNRGSVPAIQIPSSSSGRAGGFGEFDFGGEEHSSIINKPPPQIINGMDMFDDDAGFLPDADFGFDADGNLYDIDPVIHTAAEDHVPSAAALTHNNSAAIERVRQEHDHAQRANVEVISIKSSSLIYELTVL